MYYIYMVIATISKVNDFCKITFFFENAMFARFEAM